MFPYPTDLPTKEIQDVISTITTKSFATNSAGFAKDVWVIAGFALSKTVGELPQTFGVVSSSGPESLTDDEAVAILQSCCDTADQPPGAVQAINIPWKLILGWALKLLAQLTAA